MRFGMDRSPTAPSQNESQDDRGVILADEEIVVSAEKASGADVRRNLQNQQNYQNN
jgi:glutathione synthase/RimK-type ligase-like ATP-grasp enzyme